MKSLLDAMATNHCKTMAAPGSKGQESSHVETEKLDPKEHREFRSGAGICQYMTEQRFGIAFSTKKIMREAAGPTTASKTKLKRTARFLKGRQGRRHPCDRGCRLGWRPKDKVLHVRRSVGKRSVLHCSTLVCDTGKCVAMFS